MWSKDKALRTIRGVFKEQGGTGWNGCSRLRDACCAVGAVGLVQTGDPYDRYLENEREFTKAHDSALHNAKEMRLAGIETLPTGEVRALYGTPAYRYVMRAINKVANG